MDYIIERMTERDWDEVSSIFVQGLETGNATFETEAPDWARWNRTHLAQPRLVARAGGRIVGWDALSPVTERCVHSGVAEVSLYVAASARRRGVGSALLTALIEGAEQCGIWTLQGGIFPENLASLGLVKKHGFREVGRREKLGKMLYGPLAGTWRDVVFVERRSRVVGVE
jgi:L-amino acid N-acyltransferase YncA